MDSYATLDQIVRSALADDGEQSLHKYQRYLHFAFEGAKDFFLDSAQDVKTVMLTMNNIKQVELPVDYVDWVKVGIRCGDVIKTFGVQDNLPLLHNKDDCDNPVPFDSCGCDVNTLPTDYGVLGGYKFFNFTNQYGEIIGGLFGVGGGYTDRGYFTVIRNQGDHGLIQFNSEVNDTEIYLEYITNGFNPTEETVINSLAEKAIKFYIHWRVEQHKNGPASGNAQAWEFQYYNELRKVRRRMCDLTPKGILELSRKYYMLSPKN